MLRSSPEVVGFLKTNLTDLAGHYHALYQDELLVDEQPEYFARRRAGTGSSWLRSRRMTKRPASTTSWPTCCSRTKLRCRCREYERTAYDYDAHEQASAAGYAAVYAHREELEMSTGARQREVKQATVDSSLRFADTFPEHEQAPSCWAPPPTTFTR